MDVDHTQSTKCLKTDYRDDERGNWHKRLRFRKILTPSPTEKNATKDDQKTMDHEKEQRGSQVFKRPDQNEPKHEKTPGSLRFTCTECKDNALFSPSELLKHFKRVHKGKGSPPTFTSLLQHGVTHQDTANGCEISKDGAQHSCLSRNGQCDFSVEDTKTFVHHYREPNSAQSIECKDNVVKHINGELKRSHPASITLDQKEDIKKNVTSSYRMVWGRKNWWKKREPEPKTQNNPVPAFKPLLTNKDLIRESQWMSQNLLPLPGAGLLHGYGELLNPEKTLEETQQFLEKTVNGNTSWAKTIKNEQHYSCLSRPATPLTQPKSESSTTPQLPVPQYPKSRNLTNLIEKNNISIPPDSTTEVVGVKMVEGKKHLIVKVIPSTKQEPPFETEVSPPGFASGGLNDTLLGSQSTVLSGQMCARQDLGNNNVSVENSAIKCPAFRVSNNATSPVVQSQRHEHQQGLKQNKVKTPHRDKTENGHDEKCCSDQKNVVKAHISDAETSEQKLASWQSVQEPLLSLSVRPKDVYHTSGDQHSLEEQESSQPMIRETEEDGHIPSPDLNTNNLILSILQREKGEYTTAIHVCGMDRPSAEKILSNSTETNSCISIDLDGESAFEWNAVDSASVSPQKCTTEPPCREIHLIQNDIINNTGLDSPNLAAQNSSAEHEGEKSHNDNLVACPDQSDNAFSFLQTLEKQPVTTSSPKPDHQILDSAASENSSGPASSPVAVTEDVLQVPVCAPGISTHPQGVLLSSTTPPSPVPGQNQEVSLLSNSSLILKKEQTGARKRKRPLPIGNSLEPVSKSKRPSGQASQELNPPASTNHWSPVPRDVERTLRLLPLCPTQPIKRPCLNQPVIVLNHPDSDIPEVTNIMRVVHKHKGHVQKVSLSKGTVSALSELSCERFCNDTSANCHASHCRREWPQNTVSERFILKLKLKKLSKSKYEVVPNGSKTSGWMPTFRCWFCGRLFKNQDLWVGHGQRHLMEATRDWDKLFPCNASM